MICSHTSGDKKRSVRTNHLSANFKYSSWRDISKKWRGFGQASVNALKLEAKPKFATTEAEYKYNMAEEQWYKDNKQDVRQYFTTGLDIENWQDVMLVESHPGAKP